MSTSVKLSGLDFDRTVAKGAFVNLEPLKVELIYGETLGEKAKFYAEHDIPEYWVVDIQSEQVHVHRTPSDGTYQAIESFGKSSFISPMYQPAATLSLAELFDLDS